MTQAAHREPDRRRAPPLHVDVQPALLRWACERAGLDGAQVTERFAAFPAWLSGEAKPTLKQLERFAQATHAPIGYLFLRDAAVEGMPIADLRTVAGKQVRRPSGNLLDAIYACQLRQDWYREFASGAGEV